jgi:hypothetical protein
MRSTQALSDPILSPSPLFVLGCTSTVDAAVVGFTMATYESYHARFLDNAPVCPLGNGGGCGLSSCITVRQRLIIMYGCMYVCTYVGMYLSDCPHCAVYVQAWLLVIVLIMSCTCVSDDMHTT